MCRVKERPAGVGGAAKPWLGLLLGPKPIRDCRPGALSDYGARGNESADMGR